MTNAKAKAMENEINILRNEVNELRLLLSGEDNDADLSQKKRK